MKLHIDEAFRRGYGSVLKIILPKPEGPYLYLHFYVKVRCSVEQTLKDDWKRLEGDFACATKEQRELVEAGR